MGYNKIPSKKMKKGGNTSPSPSYYAIGGMLDKKLGGGMLAALNIKKKKV